MRKVIFFLLFVLLITLAGCSGGLNTPVTFEDANLERVIREEVKSKSYK